MSNRSVWADLIERAKAVRLRAYAPYSNYLVGSALVAENGEIFVGCNVENASYGLTLCAERSAIASMVAAGAKQICALVVVTCGKEAASPCGMCRQTMAEFGEDFPVILVAIDHAGNELSYDETSLNVLLPLRFRGELVTGKRGKF